MHLPIASISHPVFNHEDKQPLYERAGPLPPEPYSSSAAQNQSQTGSHSVILSLTLLIASILIISLAVYWVQRISPLIEHPYYRRAFPRTRTMDSRGEARLTLQELYNAERAERVRRWRERKRRAKHVMDEGELGGMRVVRFGGGELNKMIDEAAEEGKSGNGGQVVVEFEGDGGKKGITTNISATTMTTTPSDGKPEIPGLGMGHEDELDPSLCAVCTDAFVVDDEIRILPCRHFYHTSCIDPWLLRYSGTCSVCRVLFKDSTAAASITTSPTPPATTIQVPAPVRLAWRIPRPHFHISIMPAGRC